MPISSSSCFLVSAGPPDATKKTCDNECKSPKGEHTISDVVPYGLRECNRIRARISDFRAEKVRKNRPIDLPFHLGQPGDLELGGGDPAIVLKLRVLGMHVDPVIGTGKVAEKVK